MRGACLLLISCLALAAGAPKNFNRIVGGSVTTIDQYPFAAALLYAPWGDFFFQSCGGSILNTRSILTAAHCFETTPPNRWRIRVGSTNANSGGAVHNVNLIISHHLYNRFTLDNDVAILRSSSAFVFNNNVRAGSIPGPNYNLGDNEVVWAVGWGAISFGGPTSEQLRHVQVWTVNQNTCRTRYGERGWPVTDNMLCAGWLDVGGRDACQGDSGGPLIHYNVVVGVTSWGLQCALARYPGVNTRISRYTAWIQSNA